MFSERADFLTTNTRIALSSSGNLTPTKMSMDWILSACVGIGLAACCGFRVFVPLLVGAVATKMGLISPTPGYEWLSGWTAITGLSVATAFELAAYYIPWLDNALDALAMPLAIGAGTLLSTSFLPIQQDLLRWGMGLMVGGGAAGVVQAGTSLLRLGSVTTTGGLANPLVATGENAASLGLSVLTVLLPLFAAALLVALVLFLLFRLLAPKNLRFTKTTGTTPPKSWSLRRKGP